jgi:hypothetical protein
VVKAPTPKGHLFVAAFFHEAVILAAQVVGVDAPPVESWMHVIAPTVTHGVSPTLLGPGVDPAKKPPA